MLILPGSIGRIGTVSGVLGGAGGQTALDQVLAYSPSLLIWPEYATMTQATDGTGAAPGTGDPVGRILDLSGNGNNIIAGTWASPADAARATLTAGNALNFSGVDDYYSLLNAVSITESMTIVRAFKRASAGIENVGLGYSVGSSPTEAFWYLSNAFYSGRLAGDTAETVISSADTSSGSFVSSNIRNASTEILRINGALKNSGNGGVLSGSLDLFGRRGGSNYNSGEISFLAAFDTELTGADLSLVEQIAAATNGATLA